MAADENRVRGTERNIGEMTNRMSALTARRQQLMRPILESPREFVLLSVRGASEKLGTDGAFLLRTTKLLGFASYPAFKLFLHELAISNATSLERMQECAQEPHSVASILQATMEQSLKNLVGLRNTLDLARVKAVAARLHGARRIILIANDLAENLSGYLEYQLTVLGLPAMAAVGSGKAEHLLRTANASDVVLAISFRHGLRATVEGLKKAHEKKAYCIGVTDTSISPVARFSDEYFVASIEGASLRSSYVAPLALADVLVAACAASKRDLTMTLLEDASKEQKSGYRWYKA